MRRNTACESMIRDFAELKKRGITVFLCSTSNAGKDYKPVLKRTARGVSAYANKMYDKYGDGVSVEVCYFDADLKWVNYCTYGA